ncbi:bis(5'-nucleosyl)-tetraphosphatase, partial [Citrobacter sp. AAK_AS5]
GDLVNRGGQSLETLKLLHSLRDHIVVTLGNHDLSLLAIAGRRPDEQRRVNPDLQRVLFDDDATTLIDWLRAQKLMHVD